MNKKSSFVVLMLILTSLVVLPSPMARADGAADGQDIWAQCEDTDYPDQYAGTYNGDVSIENNILGSVVNHTDLWGYQDDWTFNVTRLNGYILSSDSTQPGTAAVYEYIAWNNGGDLWGQTAEITIPLGNGWRSFYPVDPITLPPGEDPQYFAVFWSDSGLGHKDLAYDNNPTNDGEYVIKSQSYTGNYPDPLLGETGGVSRDHWVRGFITAFLTNQTGFNQYYGNATHYTARRDINVDFPSGTQNREMKFTVPKTEQLINITHYNGGAWDQTLPDSTYTLDEDYNVTHMLFTIPEATIASYGDDFRVYSGTYDYTFILRGLFSENSTLEGLVNVTAHSLSSSTEHELNGELQLCYDGEKPIQFSWSLEGGGSRRIYTYEGSYDIYIFTPDNTYSSYSFNIRDYTGSIGSGNSFLESLRVVNGTERVIERVLIWDTVNSVPLTLTMGQIYILQVRLPDDSTYRFGYFTPGSDPTPTLTIRGIAFEDQAHYVGEHVAVEFTRSNFTHIQIEYQDNLTQTDSVFVEICHLNTTQVWNDTSTDNPIQFNWYGADNETDYLVNLVAQHDYYGEVIASAWLLGEKQDLDEPPDFDTVLGAGATNLFSIFLIVGAFMLFSRATALLGLFVSIMMAYITVYLSMLDMPYLPIHVTLTLTILWGLSGGSKG